MPRKKSNTNNNVYRVICLYSTKGASCHTDFKSKIEAVSYADGLNNKNNKSLIWYGVYEIDEVQQKLIPVISKRIQYK